jgi:dipeptidyl aminopeptidase/acylaminoacyl peptidase
VEKRRNGTPFFLITGTEDDVVDRSQTNDFLLALRQSKFYARRVVLQGAGHFFESEPLDEPSSSSLQVSGPLLRFFDEFLKGVKKAE